jgi:hypothetical protein
MFGTLFGLRLLEQSDQRYYNLKMVGASGDFGG